MPAFEGSFFEQEYFRPSLEEFRRHAQLGSPEDKLFFAADVGLHQEFPPWMDRTWDHGGCLRFGEFQWSETLGRVVQLKKSLQSDVYKELVSDWETAIIGALTAENQVCTCRRKEAVAEDLQQVISYLEKEPSLSLHLAKVRAGLDAIRSGKIPVRSEAEKHCSGG